MFKWVGRLPIPLALIVALILAVPAPATSDEIYQPSDYGSTYNGYKIYVSPAEHGGANVGCDGYVEDANMRMIARKLSYNLEIAEPLVERGYRVRLGTGDVNQNVNSSNSWNPNRHLALHSNAAGFGSCPGRASGEGTKAYTQSGKPLSGGLGDDLARLVGGQSPGTGDTALTGQQFIEINSTNAVAVLLEIEFHTWLGGVNWLRDNRETIAWYAAIAIEQHLGYP